MKHEKIRLLHVVGRFGVGGYERQQTELIKRLPAERFDQTIATMDKSGPFLREVEERGIDVVEFPFTSFYNLNALRNYRSLAGLVRRKRIQIAHCHEFYSVVFGTLGCRFAGLKKIVAGRGNMGDQHSGMQRFVQRCCYRLNTMIIPNARTVQRMLIEKENQPERKLHCIHNGIDVERFHPRPRSEELAASLGLPRGARVIGIVGTLRTLKDHRTLIKAGALVREKHSDAHLLIIGDGPTRADLEKLSRELGIEDGVTFAGERNDIPDLLALMHIFTLTSTTEGLPNTILEAMATGLPVVATNVGGVPELVSEGETGYLVPVGDQRQLAEKIILLLDDPAGASAMGTRARDIAIERFSCERFVAEMQALYDRVLHS